MQFFIKRYIRKHDRKFSIISEESFDDCDNLQVIDSVLKTIHQIDPKVTKKNLLETMSHETTKLNEPFWTLDPIDGTFGFLKGKSFSIALALISEGIPQIGFLCSPALESNKETYLLYSAVKNQGSFVCETHNNVTRKLSLDRYNHNSTQLIYCETTTASLNHKHAEAMQLIKNLNENHLALRIDSQYKYAVIAEGKADIFLRLPAISSPCKIWDHAAGSLILSEAGGVVSDGNGKDLDFGNPPELNNIPIIIASANQELHEKILNLI